MFECDICGKKLKTSQALAGHQQLKHKDQLFRAVNNKSYPFNKRKLSEEFYRIVDLLKCCGWVESAADLEYKLSRLMPLMIKNDPTYFEHFANGTLEPCMENFEKSFWFYREAGFVNDIEAYINTMEVIPMLRRRFGV